MVMSMKIFDKLLKKPLVMQLQKTIKKYRCKRLKIKWFEWLIFQDEMDMDDEAMLRLDPLIAEVFWSQIKKSSNMKIINEKFHHQFHVLDLIESVIKKDDRMRFVLVSSLIESEKFLFMKIYLDKYSSIDWNINESTEYNCL
jgi:hypothetical protein